MGAFSGLALVLQNEFPDITNYAELYSEFLKWLEDEEQNMMFVPSNRLGYYADLCNNDIVPISDVVSYWCKHVKKGIHDGEGFVIKQ